MPISSVAGTASSRTTDEAIGQALLRYRVMATVVGVLLIALILVAVPVKYLADIPEPTTVLGTAHGWLYGLFFLSAVDLALRARWTVKGFLLTVIAGTVRSTVSSRGFVAVIAHAACTM